MSVVTDIRLDIGDDGAVATQRFTDAQLISLISKGAGRLNRRLYLAGTDEEITVDAAGEITPTEHRDLLLLQVECLIQTRAFDEDVSTGRASVRITDGEQTIDTTDMSALRLEYLASPHGPCAELKEGIRDALLNSDGGKMVW